MADGSQERKKVPQKRCSSCGFEQAVAQKKCRSCKSNFVPKGTDWKGIEQMGKTNITEQKQLMFKRANILNYHHGCDVVIFMRRRHGQGLTVVQYGTKGAGQAFIGNNADKKASEDGSLARGLFSKFMNEFYSSSEQDASKTASTSVAASETSAGTFDMSAISPPTPLTNVSAATFASNSQATTGTSIPLIANATTTIPSTTFANISKSSSTVPTVVANPSPTIPSTTFASNVFSSTTPTCNTTSFNPMKSADKAIVLYKTGHKTVAMGHPHPERKVLHGMAIPSGYECVEVTWVDGIVKAPLVLGDPDENGTITMGQYFALPKKDLVNAQITFLA